MLNVKDHKTERFFDPWRYLGPKRRKLLDKSWAGLFREQILDELPVNEVAKKFNQDLGRPTKELFTVTGAVLLQQLHDLTDEQTVGELAFNLQWHYALDITEESDDAKYICEKTLWSVREIMAQEGLDKKTFEKTADNLV